MVRTRSTSSSDNSPALLLVSISAFLKQRNANRRPTPLMDVNAKASFTEFRLNLYEVNILLICLFHINFQKGKVFLILTPRQNMKSAFFTHHKGTNFSMVSMVAYACIKTKESQKKSKVILRMISQGFIRYYVSKKSSNNKIRFGEWGMID
ncbi:hypothetical protein BpHYR1_001292 [Brachionus plicatilis]|uniref:Uncharacterized protein n=1 Tax=Brachionus plicatilis TaxID=10195 RepID=A0A3M7P4U6_BRAPC|nr:hypothetical protein BpHYR1_001292 [Brachionus plicatilis]